MSSPADHPDRPWKPSQRTGTVERFLLSVGREVAEDGLTPDVLARAVAQVLPVAAAGLSLLVGGLRLAVGASDPTARHAEELETTLGEGPCLDAADAQRLAVASQADLDARWPVYAARLREHTPFRSTAAVPLHAAGGGVIAALDLYSRHPDPGEEMDLRKLDRIARPAAALLSVCLDEIEDIENPEAGPGWYCRATARRHDVWVAAGMVMTSRAVSAHDALSLLRGHAYSHDCTLDDLSARLIEGHLPVNLLDG